jgi:hypothetical protein
MTTCAFATIEPGLQRCTVCGRLARHATTHVHAECRGPQPMGLGDMVKAGLSAVGITQERVAAVLGDCGGCEQRQEALNEFGRAIGIGRPQDGTPKESA